MITAQTKLSLSPKIAGEAGITLLELLISLSVLLIISVCLWAPKARSEQRELYNACLRLQADIRQAQHTAVLEGRDYMVAFRRETGYYQLSKSALKIDYTVNLGNVAIASTTFPSDKLVFTARGTPSSGGTISLRLGRFTQELTVVPSSGRVAVQPVK